MEFREYAQRILAAETIDAKLAGPGEELTDHDPGPPVSWSAPGRPPNLTIVRAAEAPVPAIEGMPDPAQRPRILHAFANHELQAAELFSWALLAFPGSPGAFRRGLVRILREEQMHCRLYRRRLREMDVELGDFPVSGYFWNKVASIRTPAQFVCAMSLTFENANLDHTVDYAEAARDAGDEQTASLIERIHGDEIDHVRFGWQWLNRLKRPDENATAAYLANIAWPLRPRLARGSRFRPASREAAGLDPEFVRMLAEGRDDPPDGKPRGPLSDGAS